MSTTLSVGRPEGPYNSSCGYCSSSTGNHYVSTFSASQLSCEVYQHMIDRGWRRSGSFCYKPNLRLSCCPSYTIRLDALEFKASKSQRKLVNRWNRFVFSGEGEGDGHIQGRNFSGDKSSKSSPFSLSSSIHAAESYLCAESNPSHEFKVTLEPSSFTQEKYALFEKYQNLIHNDYGKSTAGFTRFLVDSPLSGEAIPYPSTPPSHLPSTYGSYHQLYRLDGHLIAMSVLDVLPNCVSSVYFMYDKTWEKFSFGKLSALREISLANEMHEAGAPGMYFLYLGFYIHSCQKMKYKADYSPSYLGDPETYTWHPFETCVPLLDKHRYACFSSPAHSLAGAPGQEDLLIKPDMQVPREIAEQIFVIWSNRSDKVPLTRLRGWKNLGDILCCIKGLGFEVSKKVIFIL